MLPRTVLRFKKVCRHGYDNLFYPRIKMVETQNATLKYSLVSIGFKSRAYVNLSFKYISDCIISAVSARISNLAVISISTYPVTFVQ